ncbi:immunoglobulin-like domain-containing protein [Alkalicoccus urumqiensis]|uniref:Bacterial Ig-like domain-containing protein n=1 Tax=Alkalicoccus urumqiensis TaxID=1548213 RepID=A0A2P6MDX7_ALKUR|nr:immunoglobulin-like domain-containing protein [Alkalicoccus urumqiensis]PRO64489.1 hypothetical protein C6I21_14270 [Alkalicoccus urumqiensis]
MHRKACAGFVILAGCSSGPDVETGAEPEAAPAEVDSVYGSMDGDVEEWIWHEAEQADVILDTEYEAGSGEAFMDYFSASAGHQLPGDEAFIRGVTVPVNGSVRYRLTEREADLSLKEVVEEQTTEQDSFEVEMPEGEALYLISAETLDEDGRVTDTHVGKIGVAPQEANAELHLEQSASEAELTLENRGPTDLFFGHHYTLEKEEDGSWETAREEAFDDIGLTLPPGDTYEQDVSLDGLEEGTYRITKSFIVHGTDIEEDLGVHFTIDE